MTVAGVRISGKEAILIKRRPCEEGNGGHDCHNICHVLTATSRNLNPEP